MNNEFWDHLLAAASAIEELADQPNDGLLQVRAHMESIEVLFHRAFDPADDYPEYVAVTLCRAINQALAKKQ